MTTNIRADRRKENINTNVSELKLRVQILFENDSYNDFFKLIRDIDKQVYQNEMYLNLPQKYQLLIKGYIDAWWDVRRAGYLEKK